MGEGAHITGCSRIFTEIPGYFRIISKTSDIQMRSCIVNFSCCLRIHTLCSKLHATNPPFCAVRDRSCILSLVFQSCSTPLAGYLCVVYRVDAPHKVRCCKDVIDPTQTFLTEGCIEMPK